MDSTEVPAARAAAWLRVEGLVAAAAATAGYAVLADAGWLFFALLFFLPDLSFAGYLAGPRIGAVVYNVAHTYTTAALPLAVGVLTDSSRPMVIGLVWVAHIGFDRTLGYGLKLPAGFRYTHLGMIGGARDGKGDEDGDLG